MFRAALEVGLGQLAFDLLARARRRGLIARPERLAGVLQRVGRLFDGFGSSLGGMVVRVAGADAQGSRAARAWHIAADHDHGPEIPCMAAILLVRRLAEGRLLPVGARACMGVLELEDFASLFEQWGMVTDVVDESDAPAL